MLLLALAFLGGVLTILSPCILPILPFVFARADQPFRKSGLPLLLSMAVTFALIATLAVTGGSWLVRTNQYGRYVALVIFVLLGLSLLFPSLAEMATRPFVRIGDKLSNNADNKPRSEVVKSLLLGVATGLLWAPCAGPILGLILAGAAVSGPSAHTSFLLLAYAAGAATSLAIALFAGNRVFSALKSSLGAEEIIRRVLGVLVLLGAVAVALGLDRGILSKLSLANTGNVEQRLVNHFHPRPKDTQPANGQDNSTILGGLEGAGTATQGKLPDLSGATAWINSAPLTPADLKGKVVLIDFWTYSCINCLRTLPYVKAWNDKYKADGLIVIGVHTPEFPFEKDQSNVEKAVHDLGVTYPVAMDNDYKIWNAFHNEYWPAHYFIDANGNIRFHHFGEGNYDESERYIQQLLKERNGSQPVPSGTVAIDGKGVEAGESSSNMSPETYVGYSRAAHFASPGGFESDEPSAYALPPHLRLNEWAFQGKWNDQEQIAESLSASAAIEYRFHARDLHLVLGPPKPGQQVHFKVTIDGKAPGENHGEDADADGNGVITGDRLYQLIRQKGDVTDHTFRIEFTQPGARAFAFTFG